jgi:hypothetical protein
MAPGAPPARWRAFVCVGLAYFLIGVIVPTVLLKIWGERGNWTVTGVMYSVLGGVLGALGALGIILAFTFGGKPIYVAPLVFGAAPVVNSFLTIYLAGRMREIGPLFLAGIVMVILGAVTVLICAPTHKAAAGVSTDVEFSRYVLQLLSIAMVAICWGAYGPTLHKGQAAMNNSRLRPFLCVGLAYFAIAVVVPNLILAAGPGEASSYTPTGTTWSLLAGAAGAIGALGIIMAFNFGGRPVYVMPLVFGGAPVVATLTSTIANHLADQIGPMFLAGLILVIAGAAMVLVFAPKGHGPHPAPAPVPAAPPKEEPAPAT